MGLNPTDRPLLAPVRSMTAASLPAVVLITDASMYKPSAWFSAAVMMPIGSPCRYASGLPITSAGSNASLSITSVMPPMVVGSPYGTALPWIWPTTSPSAWSSRSSYTRSVSV